jgi:membrane-associated protein
MWLAAIAGCLFGYAFGRRVGGKLFERKESVLFKKKYVEMTQTFYNKHGGKTLVLGRFLPIIRTFAPILAGVIKVDFKTFMFFNVLGATLWVGILSTIGFFLGSKFPFVSHYLEYIVISFVLVTSLIVLRAYLKERKAVKSKSED